MSGEKGRNIVSPPSSPDRDEFWGLDIEKIAELVRTGMRGRNKRGRDGQNRAADEKINKAKQIARGEGVQIRQFSPGQEDGALRPCTVNATVKGSVDRHYGVCIEFSTTGSVCKSECSCPDVNRGGCRFCKHLAAVLIHCIWKKVGADAGANSPKRPRHAAPVPHSHVVYSMDRPGTFSGCGIRYGHRHMANAVILKQIAGDVAAMKLADESRAIEGRNLGQ